MSYKLMNILIGSIYFLAAAVTFSCQRVILDMFVTNPTGFNLGGYLFQHYNDLSLLVLAVIFLCIGVFFTFFSKIGKPQQ